jgi:hypothetical protein
LSRAKVTRGGEFYTSAGSSAMPIFAIASSSESSLAGWIDVSRGLLRAHVSRLST